MFLKDDNYLAKPRGCYKVGFKDFHWMNGAICPDVNFNGTNLDDFSSDNKAHCRELMLRIYYPTLATNIANSFYYKPFLKWQKKELLEKLPTIPKDEIKQLTQLKSYTFENAQIANEKKFPVLLFCPGFGLPAQVYENYIGDLVSHGYIVVGINSPFINRVALPNGHVIEEAQAKSFDEFEKTLVPLQIKDLLFVLNQIHLLHDSDSLFSAMNLTEIGAFGHSMGARVIADAVHAHPEKFKAAATLDIGIDESGKSLKKFAIPFMQTISANRKQCPQAVPVVFELGKDNFLVAIAKDENDHDYSRHDNFTDLSTLQNLSAFQTIAANNQRRFNNGFDIKVLSHDLTKEEQDSCHRITYVLIKKNDKWHFCVYEERKKTNEIDISMVDGLDVAIAQLPKKKPEDLTASELEPIKKVMASVHFILLASYLGTGNGLEISHSINTYLHEFFDIYLKGKENSLLKQNSDQPLPQNTYIKVGPGQG